MRIRHALGDMRFMKTLFTSAEQEAQHLGDELPGPEHLLLAAMGMPDDSARRALTQVGATADDVRGAIGRVHAAALRTLGIDADDDGLAQPSGDARSGDARQAASGPFRSTGAAQDVFQRAVAHSKDRSPARLRTADLVLAVAEQHGGTIAGVLAALDIDADQLAVAAHQAVDHEA